MIGGPVAPGAQERLLNQIFGILEGGEHPVAVDLQLRTVALRELGEGRVIAGLDGARQLVDAIRNRPGHYRRRSTVMTRYSVTSIRAPGGAEFQSAKSRARPPGGKRGRGGLISSR